MGGVAHYWPFFPSQWCVRVKAPCKVRAAVPQRMSAARVVDWGPGAHYNSRYVRNSSKAAGEEAVTVREQLGVAPLTQFLDPYKDPFP